VANILLVAKEKDGVRKLQESLTERGYACSIATFKDKIVERVIREIPDLIIVETNGQAPAILRDLIRGIKMKHKAAIIALLNETVLGRPEDYLDLDDFILQPVNLPELDLRIKRLLKKQFGQSEIIRSGELYIDLANCEVRVAGKIIELTFKEYELLKFMVKDRGRVFTRETLLNKVWGYDYFGGDRTVDVHVRRLRSKIETTDQTFIETVRNIGYRFKRD